MNKNHTGIYQIIHYDSSKCYIGSVMHPRGFNTRWSNHISKLNKGIHHSIKLQNAWNKYSIDAFDFSILEEIIRPLEMNDKDWKKYVLNREQHYLDVILFASHNDNRFHQLGYNILRKAGSTFGYRHTDETKKKIKTNHAHLSGLDHPRYGKRNSELQRSIACKLKKEDVILIRIMLTNKVSQRVIAQKFNMAQQTISEINTGKIWKG